MGSKGKGAAHAQGLAPLTGRSFLKEDCLLRMPVNPDLKLHVLNAAVLSFLHIFASSLLFLEHAADILQRQSTLPGMVLPRKEK